MILDHGGSLVTLGDPGSLPRPGDPISGAGTKYRFSFLRLMLVAFLLCQLVAVCPVGWIGRGHSRLPGHKRRSAHGS